MKPSDIKLDVKKLHGWVVAFSERRILRSAIFLFNAALAHRMIIYVRAAMMPYRGTVVFRGALRSILVPALGGEKNIGIWFYFLLIELFSSIFHVTRLCVVCVCMSPRDPGGPTTVNGPFWWCLGGYIKGVFIFV